MLVGDACDVEGTAEDAVHHCHHDSATFVGVNVERNRAEQEPRCNREIFGRHEDRDDSPRHESHDDGQCEGGVVRLHTSLQYLPVRSWLGPPLD
eukprot:5138935-Prymnesium_polylepis.1